jgi:hypothetical protein
MSTLSLNLLSIAVFTFTLTSLLGPMLNLSPMVPAFFAFGLMGLVTADTLAWNGQGTTLFVDWFAQRSPEHRERIAHHEAGHFLVATLLDIPVTGYALSAWEAFRQGQPSQGGVQFDDAQLQAQLEQGVLSQHLIDRYCQVWMAGGAAEMLVYGNVEGAKEDVQKVRFLLGQLASQGSIALNSSQWEQKERWAAFQAKQLIQQHRAAYDALVQCLQAGASVETCKATIANTLTPVNA